MDSPISCIPTTSPDVSIETSHPSPTGSEVSIENWDDFVRATIQQGDVLYPSTYHASSKDCYWYYTHAARNALAYLQAGASIDDRVARLQDALQRARIAVIILAAFVDDNDSNSSRSSSPNYQQAAWILRKCFHSFIETKEFDAQDILSISHSKSDASTSSFASAFRWPPRSTTSSKVAADSRQRRLPRVDVLSSPLFYPDLDPIDTTPIKAKERTPRDRPTNDPITPKAKDEEKDDREPAAVWSWNVRLPAWLVVSSPLLFLAPLGQSPLLYQCSSWIASLCLAQYLSPNGGVRRRKAIASTSSTK
jgi:hypothetical protein